jgi:hypothetical protein
VLLANAFGATGAACAWLALNLGHMLITQHIMHRRILPHEKLRWYIDDTVKPVLIAAIIAGTAKVFLTEMTLVTFAFVGAGVLLAIGAACIWSLHHLRASSVEAARRLLA